MLMTIKKARDKLQKNYALSALIWIKLALMGSFFFQKVFFWGEGAAYQLI